jgi:protein-S-isoprenylcysteine O-methyltransferase Ste14
MSEVRDSAGVRFPPPLIYVAGLALGFGLNWPWPLRIMPQTAAWALGAALLVMWVVVGAAAIPLFVRAKTPLNPAKPVTSLVTSGIYRLTRNPMYLALALFYLGCAVIGNSLWALVLFVPVIAIVHVAVIGREERYLERTFGDTYREYARQVRRWL